MTLVEKFARAFAAVGLHYAKHRSAAGQGGLFDASDPDFERLHPRDHGKFTEKGHEAAADRPADLAGQKDLFGGPSAPAPKPAAKREPPPEAPKFQQSTMFHGLKDMAGQRDLFDLDYKGYDQPESSPPPDPRKGALQAAGDLLKSYGKKLPPRAEMEKHLGPTVTQDEAEQVLIHAGLDELTAANEAWEMAAKAKERGKPGIDTPTLVIVARSELSRADREGRLKEALSAAGDASVLRLGKPGSDVTFTVHPATQNDAQGKWQITRWDQHGPSGHQYHDTRELAIASAIGAHPEPYWDEGDQDYRVIEKAGKPAAQAAKPDLKTLAPEDLHKTLWETTNAFPPTTRVEDWGSGRGQGKRMGGMVRGGMADPPRGKKTYTQLFGGLPDYQEHKEDLDSLTTGKAGNLAGVGYLKARSAGLDHEEAMVYAYGLEDGVGAKYLAEKWAEDFHAGLKKTLFRRGGLVKKFRAEYERRELVERFARAFARYARIKSAAGQKGLFDAPANPEFEREHPRNADGEFSKKGEGQKAEAKAPSIPEVKEKPHESEAKVEAKPDAPKPDAPKPLTDREQSLYDDYRKLCESFKLKPREPEEWAERYRSSPARKADSKPAESESKQPEPESKGASGESNPEPTEPEEAKQPDAMPDWFGNDTPREAAKKAAQRTLDDNYAFARSSAIPNAGEDLMGSARHKANAWRGLEEAEKDGTAAEQVTRDKLLRNEPHNLMVHVSKNPLTSLVMHLALRGFPSSPAPSSSRRKPTPEEAAQNRRQYLEAYRKIKTKAEELAASEEDPVKAARSLGSYVNRLIGEYRGQAVVDGKWTRPTDPLNATGNNLVDLSRRLSGRGKMSALGQAGLFAKAFDTRYKGQDLSPEDKLDKLASHAGDVIEGASINKTFGVDGKGAKEFKLSDLYVKSAERKGGPTVAETPIEARDALLKRFKMRGLQFGNYVTDEERTHHLMKCAEAFADLADVLGIPEEYASWKGRIGIAFGARGHAGASAHYETDKHVINLTRASGAGALAHEWGHAFDHALGGDENAGMLTSRGTIAHGTYMSDHGGLAYTWSHDKGQQTVDKTKDPLWKAFQKVKSIMETSGFNKRLRGALREAVNGGLIGPKKIEYWNSNVEKFARCFERHVQRKLEKAGRKNTYLAGMLPLSYKIAGMDFWPTDEEVDELAPAFDEIFKEFRAGVEKGRYSLVWNGGPVLRYNRTLAAAFYADNQRRLVERFSRAFADLKG